MSETLYFCTKQSWEPCKLHPVDCPNCINADVCQVRETKLAHPDAFRSCRFYRSKQRRLA